MLGFLHFMLSYSLLSPSFHSSLSVGLQKIIWHCLILCLQNALLFYLHPVLLCFFKISKHIMHAIWLCSLVLSLTPSFFVSLRSFSLDARFPSVNRECIVPGQILSVLSVDCFVCGNHHDGLRSPRCKRTFPLTPSRFVWQSANNSGVWFGVLRLIFSPFKRQWM